MATPKENYSNIQTLSFDAVIVGGGGSGMRASYQLAQAGFKSCSIDQSIPDTFAYCCCSKGIGASLGNMQEDNWHYHFYDTVKGSDWLGDQDAIEFMTREAPKLFMSLNASVCRLTVTKMVRSISVHFGGPLQTTVKKPYHVPVLLLTVQVMHYSYFVSKQRKMGTQFYVEWIALDLIRNEAGDVLGVTAIDQETGNIAVFQAKATLFATGGAGRVYRASTNAYINTGDGLGMAARAGIPLQDMEFWQFHPTGVAGAGVLLTEGCRGEGGILRNKDGEPFMERYAPTLKDLAPRDFVSRSMDQEIKEGRGCGPKADYILLDMTYLGAETIMKRLPSVFEIGKKFANVDCTKEPIPVVPTIHYQMVVFLRIFMVKWLYHTVLKRVNSLRTMIKIPKSILIKVHVTM